LVDTGAAGIENKTVGGKLLMFQVEQDIIKAFWKKENELFMNDLASQTMEQEVIDITADLWNKVSELPPAHPDDINDLRFHINAIQNILYARVGMRVMGEPKKNDDYGGRIDQQMVKK
jgi:hypothetical protein